MQATMTSKGQVTVPKPVREKLLLRPGDKIDFRLEDDGVHLVPVTASVTQLKGMVPKPASPVSLAAMDEAVSNAAGRRR